MSGPKPNLYILAPHIDDELIGCFSLLSTTDVYEEKTVFYFYDLTPERISEAWRLSEYGRNGMSFIPRFCQGVNIPVDVEESLKKAPKGSHILVPARTDLHEHHREINCRYRKYATSFYSVDMNVRPSPLGDAAGEKKALLDMFYPSQSALWERDHKYWLFEDIHQSDYDVYAKYTVGPFQVTTLREYQYEVLSTWHISAFGSDARDLFDAALSICKHGDVTLQDPSTGCIYKSR